MRSTYFIFLLFIGVTADLALKQSGAASQKLPNSGRGGRSGDAEPGKPGAKKQPTPSPTPPPYKRLRHDEDWNMMRDPANQMDWSDKIKYIPLGKRKGWYVSVGGESRSVYERYQNEFWGSQPQDLSGYYLQRFMAHTDFHLGERLRLFGQLKSGIEAGRRGGPLPADEDLLDVNQSFADVIWKFKDNRSLTLRAGRQELFYGSGRLIDPREGRNVRQTFDGVKLMARDGPWSVDMFAVKPVDTDPGVFDDAPIAQQTLWSVYAHRPWGPRSGRNIDLYYIGFAHRDAIYDQGTANELRHMVGARFSGKRQRWDYDHEFIYQFGSFGRGNIRAWAVLTDTGYTLRQRPWSPRIGMKANAVSGDRDPNDLDLQTFNSLFPRGAYFGQLISVGPRNLYDLHPALDLTPSPNWLVEVDWVFYWRQSVRDAVYDIPGNILRTGQLSRARFIGHQPGANAHWQITRHWSMDFWYGNFFVGRFLRETPPAKNTTFFSVWLTYKF